VINIPDVEHFLSFCVEVSRIVKGVSKIIFKLGVRVHVASYKLVSLFNDENILSACLHFDVAVEIDIAFANSDLRSVYDFISDYSTKIFTSYFLCISSIKANFPSKRVIINDFSNRVISIFFTKVKSRPFPLHINN
jgi:hypothetical protein